MVARIAAGLLIAFGLLAGSAPASACPLCKEAISTNDSEDEVNNLPAAYNNSIYLMVSVPYLTLGFGGFLIYRGLRQNAEYLRRLDELPPDQQPDQQ